MKTTDETSYTERELELIDKIITHWVLKNWTDDEKYNLINKLKELDNGYERCITELQRKK